MTVVGTWRYGIGINFYEGSSIWACGNLEEDIPFLLTYFA